MLAWLGGRRPTSSSSGCNAGAAPPGLSGAQHRQGRSHLPCQPFDQSGTVRYPHQRRVHAVVLPYLALLVALLLPLPALLARPLVQHLQPRIVVVLSICGEGVRAVRRAVSGKSGQQGL